METVLRRIKNLIFPDYPFSGPFNQKTVYLKDTRASLVRLAYVVCRALQRMD